MPRTARAGRAAQGRPRACPTPASSAASRAGARRGCVRLRRPLVPGRSGATHGHRRTQPSRRRASGRRPRRVRRAGARDSRSHDGVATNGDGHATTVGSGDGREASADVVVVEGASPTSLWRRTRPRAPPEERPLTKGGGTHWGEQVPPRQRKDWGESRALQASKRVFGRYPVYGLQNDAQVFFVLICADTQISLRKGTVTALTAARKSIRRSVTDPLRGARERAVGCWWGRRPNRCSTREGATGEP